MGCVGAGARRAARPSCSRPRKPARKEAPRECPIVPLSGVPIATVRTISGWPAAHRRAHDIRPDQRAATPRIQAVLVLRWLKDATDVQPLAQDSGISQTTAYRYHPRGPGGDRPANPRHHRHPGDWDGRGRRAIRPSGRRAIPSATAMHRREPPPRHPLPMTPAPALHRADRPGRTTDPAVRSNTLEYK